LPLPTREASYRRILGRVLVEVGAVLRDLVVLDADTARSTGVIEFAREYPSRYVNVGISEQDLLATAAGLAVSGKIPVATTFSMFIMRGWEQVRNTIARDKLNVKIIATHSGLSDYMDGASHQCLEDIALMRVLPEFVVLAPSDPTLTRAVLREAIAEHYGPVYVRLGRDNAPILGYREDEDLHIGGSRVVVEPVDAAIMSYGPMVRVALEASEILRRKGLGVGVIDIYSLKPIDKETVVKYAEKTGYIVTLEDHSVYGGLGSIVAELLAEESPTRIMRLGTRDRFGASARSYYELLEYMGLSPEQVASKIEQFLARKRGVEVEDRRTRGS